MYRKKYHLHTILGLLLLLGSILVGCESQQPSESPNGAVFCASTVQVYLPDRRLLANVHYPPGKLEEGLNLLDHDEMPSRPWPTGMRLTTHNSKCLGDWETVFTLVNQAFLGRANRFIDPTVTLDEANYRQAALHALYPDDYDVADALYPQPTVTENRVSDNE